ncbi:MAG: NUDIX domain-containing protein [Alphaproteobacteria bacterium]|nr:NUDIX domain-containing protein [Alphaproteobacteria bacterium]
MTSKRSRSGRAAHPRDAATLVLLRQVRGRPRVLMGRRHSGHKFMPDQFVFPGGRVDRADHYAPPATELSARVAGLLQRSASPGRARALALAAVRETFEETGLILGKPMAKPKRVSPAWAPFYESGYGPALDGLEYVTRAVTPPFRPLRFDARFFLVVDAELDGNLGGSGELLDLDWIPIPEAKELPIPAIQERVLGSVEEFLAAPETWRRRRTVPRYRMLHGRRVVEHE